MRGIELIAHRGASHDAPENTLAAFRLAWETGADGIEGDFRLSRDGQIVCLHDATTGRTAGVSLTVADTTLARLRELDVGAWRGSEWRGERIPTLREVIATVPPGKKLLIELKSGPAILPPLAAILAEADLDPRQVVILAFSEEVITAARRQLPRVKALWLDDTPTPAIGTVLRTLERTGASGLSCRARSAIDAPFVQALHAAGREFHVWTVDAPRTAARFAALGADSVTTNRPGWLRARLLEAAPGS
jgi:glycerophosphoryl diester phosphodiesterase